MTQPSRHFAPYLILWLISFMFLKYVLQFIPSIGLDVLKNEYHQTARNIGLLAGAYFYAYLLFQIPAGVVVDHCKISKVVFLAMGCCLIGAILFAIGKSFNELFAGRLFIGAGVAFATVSYMRAAALYFNAQAFARLTGFFGAAAMGGAGMTVLILGWLFENYGWNHLLILTIALTGLLCSLGLYFIRQENQYQKIHNNITNNISSFSLQNLGKNISTILKQKNNILLLIYNGLAFAPIAVFGGLWGKTYFTHEFQLPANQSSIIISALFYSFAIGSVVLFSLVRTLKQQQHLMIWGIVASLALFIIMLEYLPINTDFYTLFALMCAIGFCSSSFIASYSLVNAVNPATHIATAIAIVNMGDPIFGGLAEPLMGYIIDTHDGSFHTSMYVLVIYWMGAIVSGACVRIHQTNKGM